MEVTNTVPVRGNYRGITLINIVALETSAAPLLRAGMSWEGGGGREEDWEAAGEDSRS